MKIYSNKIFQCKDYKNMNILLLNFMVREVGDEDRVPWNKKKN